MSYRIHLNILTKPKYNSYLEGLRLYCETGDESKIINLSCFSKSRIELLDELHLLDFQELPYIKDYGYPDYLLTKEDLLNIIKQYQHWIVKASECNINIYNEALRSSPEFKVTKLGTIAVFTNLQCLTHLDYFKSLIDSPDLIKNSDNIILQYFYLVDLYRNYKKNLCYVISQC